MHKPVVLITGASGFIGQYAVKHFLGLDCHVIGLTREHHRLEMHPDFHWKWLMKPTSMERPDGGCTNKA